LADAPRGCCHTGGHRSGTGCYPCGRSSASGTRATGLAGLTPAEGASNRYAGSREVPRCHPFVRVCRTGENREPGAPRRQSVADIPHCLLRPSGGTTS
jgi:hypothetical protein